jgi:hypothetical protein
MKSKDIKRHEKSVIIVCSFTWSVTSISAPQMMSSLKPVLWIQNYGFGKVPSLKVVKNNKNQKHLFKPVRPGLSLSEDAGIEPRIFSMFTMKVTAPPHFLELDTLATVKLRAICNNQWSDYVHGVLYSHYIPYILP